MYDSESITVSFSCVHEQVPADSSKSNLVFEYAYWMEMDNLLRRDLAVYAQVERLYRLASENQHYKANIRLQKGALQGLFSLKAHEYLRFSEELIAANVASGYLFVGYLIQHGAAGLKQDTEMAYRYYREAADAGSAEAQYYVGEKLSLRNLAPDIALKMHHCAAQQGHGEAATQLGIGFAIEHKFEEALNSFQAGVAAGNTSSASFLSNGFRSQDPADDLYYLGQSLDIERADRYKRIQKYLSAYSYANPKVPEINDIVPLPPAPLPEWDGTLQWVEARKANIPPEKPSEALINELAKEKVLDPATGKPLPGSPVFHTANFPVLTCYSEQPCPKAGYWMMTKYFSPSGGNARYTQYFEEGQIMPLAMVTYTRPRLWPLSDKVTTFPSGVFWGMFD